MRDKLNPMDLSNHSILITGASSGIGRSIAQLFDRLGARLVLAGRDSDRLQGTLSTLSSREHRIEVFDLSETGSIPEWMQKIAIDFGPLSGIVHSAGVFQVKPLRFLTDKNWEDVLGTDLRAAMQLSKGFRQRGTYQAPGSIVFISSVMGLVGQPGTTAYAASKGALISMTRTLALELAPESIRVNSIAPGQVQTEMAENAKNSLTEVQLESIRKMHPLGLGDALDVSYAAAYLMAATGRWVTGSTLVVDGGYTAH